MTRKELEDLLKQFETWTNTLRDAGKKTVKDEKDAVPGDVLQALVKDFLGRAPMKQFLELAAAVPAASVGGPAAPAGTPGPSGDERALAEQGASVTSFDEFLSSLSRSIVDAQRRLDAASADYLASVRDKPHIAPTVFRLPRLEAQMKFGLEVKEGQRLNLLFWGRDKQTSQLNQQAISFELVSVPAAPGAIEAARRSLLQWTLVVDPGARRLLLEALKAIPADPLLDPVTGAARDPSLAGAVAFLDLADGRRFLVLYAEDKRDKDVGLWLLTVTAESRKLEVIYRFTKSLGPEEVLLRDLVLELATAQRKLSGG